MMFPDMNTACRAASVLRTETAVDAVEVFDRAALRECEADEGLTKLVVDIKGADPGAAALLIECRGEDAETLQVGYCPTFFLSTQEYASRSCVIIRILCICKAVRCLMVPFRKAQKIHITACCFLMTACCWPVHSLLMHAH